MRVRESRELADAGLDSSGFELVRSPSAVTAVYDCAATLEAYYDECGSVVREVTGAHATFSLDHVIREPEVQFSAGDTDGSPT